ncbi:MAG TPA: hypothetical protein VKR32_06410 [Puia sp.]|nr:hypothetical protein [Puia sp.]
MAAKIDTVKMIYEIKKGDVLFQQEKTERFWVVSLEEGFFVLRSCAEQGRLKMVRFPDLINEDWHVDSEQV